MSATAELAQIFDEMSAVLELTGANPFRVNAYARAARVLRDLTVDVSEVGGEKELVAIEGIGAGTAKKIVQYLDTGRVKEHDDLLDEIPRGLLEVLKIPGLGPKTVKLLWEQGGVTDIPSLGAQIEAGVLEGLPRMGAKTIANIKESIAFTESRGRRVRVGDALPVAEQIVKYLARVEATTHVEYAGSLRRGRETIGDIDIVAVSSDPGGLSEVFQEMPGVVKVLVAGSTKSSVRLEPGMQVDMRVVEEKSYGAALMYFTGSKDHNVHLRERAIKRKLRLNEYGLFREDKEAVAGVDEEGIYKALDLPWIPPELREDRGELALKTTPRLIELGDIKSELHAHTVASDGRFTIEELAREAADRGFHTVAVTDHSKSSAQAGGLTGDRLLEHIDAVREADAKIKDITILAGSEVDIHADGSLDYEDDLLAKLDLVLASPHASLRQDPKDATKRLVAAIRHPLVHIVGHPTGRIINRREGLEPDINALVQAAAESGTALELNANFFRLDLRDIHIKVAVDGGALISINTDAHRPEHFDYLRYGVLTARRGWLTADHCVNTWTGEELRKWLKSNR